MPGVPQVSCSSPCGTTGLRDAHCVTCDLLPSSSSNLRSKSDAATATRLDCHDVGTPLVGTIPAAVGDLSRLTYFAVHGPSCFLQYETPIVVAVQP